MLDLESADALASSVDRLLDAHVVGSVLTAAVELGLVAAIAEPTTAAEVAGQRKLSVDAVERILCALVALGLATRDAEGAFRATGTSLAVLGTREAPSSRTCAVRFRGNFVAPVMGRLSVAARTGAPQHRAWPFVDGDVAASPYEELQKHPAALRTFLDAMDDDARGSGVCLARMLELGSDDHVIDGGCGGGALARELLASVPGLRVESFDLAATASITAERSARAGLGSRHRIGVGDLRQPWPFRGASVVILSGVLSDFDAGGRRTVLRQAAEAAALDGRLVLSERLLVEHGTAPAGAALLSLVLLAGTEGGQLHRDQLGAVLSDGGWRLESIRPMSPADPSSRSVVVARRG